MVCAEENNSTIHRSESTIGGRSAGSMSFARTIILALLISFKMLAPALGEDHPFYTFSDLMKKERMAVVNLRSSVALDEGPMREFFGNLRMRPDQEPLGTGFVISPDGLILTNDHVVSAAVQESENGGKIFVRFLDQHQVEAHVVGRDPKTDIALLKVDREHSLPHVVLGDSDLLDVGEWVMAVGDPFGSEETVSVGIVSATERSIGSGPYDSFIQTDAAIHSGNSGGPLFNIRGEVVGISTALPSSGQGIGFAIPINMAKKISAQLRQNGKVMRAWLGVMIQEVTPELAKAFGLSRPEGALVSDVMDRSPAKMAGIMRGDVIVSFSGKRIDHMQKMPAIVAETPVGEEVDVVFIRNGKENHLRIKVTKLPDDPVVETEGKR
jgi:serine protease Do